MKAAKRIICLMLVLGLMLCSVPGGHAAGNQKLPNALFLTQEVSGTCTLSSAAMMIRSCMYINGNENWYFVTENGLKPTAWVTGTGLRWSFQYTVEGATTSVGHRTINGISASGLKTLLDEHPEGIVLYCGKIPHAVFLTGYVGDTFYCADTVNGYSGKQIPVTASWLGVKYSTQAAI